MANRSGRNGQATHPIGVVAERTGLTADVLRVWERRYGVVEPERSAGGQRLYNDAQIERLRLLHRATQAGRSIGQIAALSPHELAELVRADERARAEVPRREASGGFDRAASIDTLSERIRGLDAEGVEAELSRASAALPFVAFLAEVLAPMLRRVGDAWHAGELTPAHERLATVLGRRVVEARIAALRTRDDAPHIVVTTLSGDRHEIGALMSAAVAATEGWRVTYLGADLPAEAIATVVNARAPRAVAVGAVYAADRDSLISNVEALIGAVGPSVAVLIGGAAALATRAELEASGAWLIEDLDALRDALSAVVGRG